MLRLALFMAADVVFVLGGIIAIRLLIAQLGRELRGEFPGKRLVTDKQEHLS